MGNSSPNPANPSPNLSHLTENPEYQAVLRQVLASNPTLTYNQVYYPNTEAALHRDPIKISKSTPHKTSLAFQKKSLSLLPIPQKPGFLSLTFTFSSLCDAKITVFKSQLPEPCDLSLKPLTEIDKNPEAFRFPAGKRQQFPTIELEPTGPGLISHVVIRLESTAAPLEAISTYFHLSREGKIEDLRQKLEIGDQNWVMSEIFGCRSKENEDRMCSICLSEPFNVIITPCEHMCVCYRCCQDLRSKTSKCPICRKTIESFIKVQKKPRERPPNP